MSSCLSCSVLMSYRQRRQLSKLYLGYLRTYGNQNMSLTPSKGVQPLRSPNYWISTSWKRAHAPKSEVDCRQSLRNTTLKARSFASNIRLSRKEVCLVSSTFFKFVVRSDTKFSKERWTQRAENALSREISEMLHCDVDCFNF